jgi:hypothetical protein
MIFAPPPTAAPNAVQSQHDEASAPHSALRRDRAVGNALHSDVHPLGAELYMGGRARMLEPPQYTRARLGGAAASLEPAGMGRCAGRSRLGAAATRCLGTPPPGQPRRTDPRLGTADAISRSTRGLPLSILPQRPGLGARAVARMAICGPSDPFRQPPCAPAALAARPDLRRVADHIPHSFNIPRGATAGRSRRLRIMRLRSPRHARALS